jgi:hypothetical protein
MVASAHLGPHCHLFNHCLQEELVVSPFSHYQIICQPAFWYINRGSLDVLMKAGWWPRVRICKGAGVHRHVCPSTISTWRCRSQPSFTNTDSDYLKHFRPREREKNDFFWFNLVFQLLVKTYFSIG